MRIIRDLETNLQEPVTLYVEEPKQTRENEYGCRIGIEGAGIDIVTTIYGIDGIQSLTLAIVHLDSFVRRASKSISPRFIIWDGGKDENDYGLLVT